MHYTFIPENVCSRRYEFDIEDGIITGCKIIGGCTGNLTGISNLVIGMKVDDVIKRFEGIRCPGSRTRMTSCPDQIARALKQTL